MYSSAANQTSVVSEELASAAEAGIATIKYRRKMERRLVLVPATQLTITSSAVLAPLRRHNEPVPVRESALVAALVAESILPERNQVTVPREEVGGAVHKVGQVGMDCDKLIEVVLCGRELGIDCWECPKTLDGLDVVLALALAHVLPGE